MPVVLLTPLATFLVALSSVRTRRSSASLAMLGIFVMLVATLAVGWGLSRRSAAYVLTYSYMNLSVAFTGPPNFQSFTWDLVLHVDHVGVAALVAVELCILGILGWHQVMGRTEPGPARFYAEVSALLFGCAGVLVSWDLAEMLAFWGITGAMTYLLLAHRWGSDATAMRSRIALALPFVADLSLLCGVAWLYARYGDQHLDKLIPILHTTTGWTVRAIVVGSVLLFIGLAGRMAIWPLHSWITRTVDTAPPAASAIAQSVWPVLSIVVLYRVVPIFAASNLQTVRACMYTCAAAAVVAPLLALFGNEPRRVFALLGAGATAAGAAIVIHEFESPNFTFAVAGVACVLAAAPARAAGTLLTSVITGAMRTDDMAEMGDAWNRMRRTALALLLAGLVLGFSVSGALVYGVSTRSWLGVLLGESVVLVSLGGLRVFLATSVGPLRRRRAFEPDRVREAPQGSLGWPYLLAITGAALLVASTIKGWLNFLDGRAHPSPSGGEFALWIGVAVIGLAIAAAAYLRDKDGALRVSAVAGSWLGSTSAALTTSLARFEIAPAMEMARQVDASIRSGDRRIGRLSAESGRLAIAISRAQAIAVVLVVTVALAVAVAFFAPGVLR